MPPVALVWRKGNRPSLGGGLRQAIEMATVRPLQKAKTSDANGLRGLSSSEAGKYRIRGSLVPNAVVAAQKSADLRLLVTDKKRGWRLLKHDGLGRQQWS